MSSAGAFAKTASVSSICTYLLLFLCFPVICIFCAWMLILDCSDWSWVENIPKNKELEDAVEDKRRTYNQLLKQKQEIEATFFQQEYECLPQLKQRRHMLANQKPGKTFILKTYTDTVETLIKMVADHLDSLLLPKEGSALMVPHEKKEEYRVYGLLLSASIKGHVGQGSPDVVKEKVREKYRFSQEEYQSKVEENVRKALSLTQKMLTLLPPLLIAQPHLYHEEFQDVNRVTWDERKRKPLIYYRPILVYGNHLHVAIKGLVGNSETVVPDEGGHGDT